MASTQDSNQDRPPKTTLSPQRGRLARWLPFVAGLLIFNYWAGSQVMAEESRVRVPYSPFFLEQVRAGNVVEITSKGTAIQGTLAQPESYDDSEPTTSFKTEIPAFADTDALSRLLQREGVIENARPLDSGASWWATLLIGFGPTLLLVGLLVWLGRRAGNVQNALGSFGRSSARRYQPSGDRVTFANVAGVDEAKQELTEVVDFLRNPDKYARLGGRIPHGVLLSGPPGTGKTLLARALAGEANVPFFSLAASEFVEAIVGVGAARVRDLFKQAKAEAPSIIFIDELDAVGRSRTSGVAGFSGGNDEREQTLNQILTEMDGFGSSTKVIVIGATNRPEVLDPALLRPGRFDRRVAVQPPDRNGRRQILDVHTRGVPLAPDADLDVIAASTPGMVGADLANLVNEATLLAARRNHPQVTEADFTDALEKIVLGTERKVLMTPADRRRTAYHEGGHALVGMLTDGADPVRRISIIPRGQSLGVTYSAPDVRPLQLLRPGAASAHRRRPGRTNGRRDRLRRHHHRRRVGHPAAHPDRSPDGWSLGDERHDRAGRGAPAGRMASPGRRVRGDPAPGRRRGAQARCRRPRRCHPPPDRASRPARQSRRGAARTRDARPGRRLRRRRNRGAASGNDRCNGSRSTLDRRAAMTMSMYWFDEPTSDAALSCVVKPQETCTRARPGGSTW